MSYSATVQELIDNHGGGIWKGRRAKAAIPGGISMGLIGPQGSVVMMADLTAAETTAEVLSIVLTNFADKARLWRGFVETGGAGRDETDESLLHTIRV